MPSSSRGEVWRAELDPPRGHEQGGTRPCLVVSVDAMNHGPADMVIVVPITRRERRVVSHVEVNPPEGGLTYRSFIKCEDVRAISQERLQQRLGAVAATTMARVELRLRMLLGL